jgi:hypothetical protein
MKNRSEFVVDRLENHSTVDSLLSSNHPRIEDGVDETRENQPLDSLYFSHTHVWCFSRQ